MFSTPATTDGDNDNAGIAEDPTSSRGDNKPYDFEDYDYGEYDYGKFSVQFSQSIKGCLFVCCGPKLSSYSLFLAYCQSNEVGG